MLLRHHSLSFDLLIQVPCVMPIAAKSSWMTFNYINKYIFLLFHIIH